jgi:hypothetical protein
MALILILFRTPFTLVENFKTQHSHTSKDEFVVFLAFNNLHSIEIIARIQGN